MLIFFIVTQRLVNIQHFNTSKSLCILMILANYVLQTGAISIVHYFFITIVHQRFLLKRLLRHKQRSYHFVIVKDPVLKTRCALLLTQQHQIF